MAERVDDMPLPACRLCVLRHLEPVVSEMLGEPVRLHFGARVFRGTSVMNHRAARQRWPGMRLPFVMGWELPVTEDGVRALEGDGDG